MEAHCYLIDPFGCMHIDPNAATIRSQLEILFSSTTDDCPHRDLSLSDYASGYVLIYHHNRTITLENNKDSDAVIQFISGVALEEAFALFNHLNDRALDAVLEQPWKPQT